MATKIRILVLVLVTVGSLNFPSVGAQAQSGADGLEAAREHMEDGQDLFVQHQYVAAAAQFMAAYAIQPYGAFLFNAAVSLERANDLEAAITAFRRYVESDPRPRDSDAVLERIAALEARLAASQQAEPVCGDGPCDDGGLGLDGGVSMDGGVGVVDAATPPPLPDPQEIRSMISVRTDPEGAEVTLLEDGEPISSGAAPFAESVEEGAYRLRIDHPDYETSETDIQVRAGTVYVVIMNLSQGEFLGYLRVQSDPPGGRVFIDDRAQGSPGVTPYVAALPVGDHQIWVERPGYTTIEETVTLGLGEHVNREVTLERVSYGRIRVLANIEGARVFVDDERVGAVPWEGDIPAGDHEVRVESDGQKDWERTVTVQRGQLTPVRIRLRRGVPRGGAWTSLIMGLALAGAGGYFAYATGELEDELDAARAMGTLASDDPRIDRGFYYSLAANGGFGLGGILGLMSIYLFVRDPLPDSDGFILDPRDWGYGDGADVDESEEGESESPEGEAPSQPDESALYERLTPVVRGRF